jgi:hypothetical protein
MNAADYPRSSYEVYFEKFRFDNRWLVRLYSYADGFVVEEQSGVGSFNVADEYIKSRMPAYARKEHS